MSASAFRSSAGCLLAGFVLAVVACAPARADDEGEHAAPAGGKTATVHVDEHAEGPIEWRNDLALWSMVAFLIVLAILGKFAWGPLSRGLLTREQRIRDDIAAAESARHKAEAMLREHEGRLEAVQEEVRGILAEARRDAEVARQNILSDAQREAAATQQRAIEEIKRAEAQAINAVFETMNQQILAATEHVLGRSVNEQDQGRLIEEALANLRRQPS